MSTLSSRAIKEYKEIYKEEYGEELTDKEIAEQAHNLINFFKLIYKPIPKKDASKKDKKNSREKR